jgi:hypothetical protein
VYSFPGEILPLGNTKKGEGGGGGAGAVTCKKEFLEKKIQIAKCKFFKS